MIFYYRDKEREHYYKYSENTILHVLVRRKSRAIRTVVDDRFHFETSAREKESLINSLNPDEFSKTDLIETSQDEFEEVLREAIFNLDIFEYAKTYS